VATQAFSRQLQVLAPPQLSWSVLTDVDRLASWVGIVHDVVEVLRLERYSARLQDQVGPFKLRADLDVAVHVLSDGHEIELAASGRDRVVDSRISVRAVLRLAAADHGGSTIEAEGTYEVTGRVASMGAGVIQKKADRILAEFFSSAARELGSAR
jgi:uncharacterized protein